MTKSTFSTESANDFDAKEERSYTMSEKAIAQRKANASRKRWFAGLQALNEKMSLKTDEYRLMDEICSNLTAIFKFQDLIELFPDDYNQAFGNNKRFDDLQSENEILKSDNVKFELHIDEICKQLELTKTIVHEKDLEISKLEKRNAQLAAKVTKYQKANIKKFSDTNSVRSYVSTRSTLLK